jgi:hypothetical protein
MPMTVVSAARGEGASVLVTVDEQTGAALLAHGLTMRDAVDPRDLSLIVPP